MYSRHCFNIYNQKLEDTKHVDIGSLDCDCKMRSDVVPNRHGWEQSILRGGKIPHCVNVHHQKLEYTKIREYVDIGFLQGIEEESGCRFDPAGWEQSTVRGRIKSLSRGGKLPYLEDIASTCTIGRVHPLPNCLSTTVLVFVAMAIIHFMETAITIRTKNNNHNHNNPMYCTPLNQEQHEMTFCPSQCLSSSSAHFTCWEIQTFQ
ncbi:hypothetical protein IV203_014381 [Nitzschia inconspicua]|uniref:Uncharacterized protein n=1 Tax=Nitzschia inconspicua TaxID=303405 RepID=A0A9K3PUN3_9STRA|nr:hypothetical protein IV203_014381 [Nitzschia inconspicua]